MFERAPIFVLLVTLAALFAGTATAQDISPEDTRRFESAEKYIDKTSREIVEKLRDRIERDLKARHDKLTQDINRWREDQSYETIVDDSMLDVRELSRGIKEGESLAAAHGVDVKRLHDLFEATKRVIRRASFEIPSRPRIDRDDRPHVQVAKIFVLAHEFEKMVAEAEAKNARYKTGLYKKAALAYISALNAAREPLGPCRPSGRKMLKIGGSSVPTAECPDPVVRKLRAYLNAIRKIQSADTDTLIARAEEIIAEQQLVADMIAGVPLVGDALDIYAVYSGEELSGRKMSKGVRIFVGILTAIPLVNSATAQRLFDQAAKRSARAAAAFEKLTAFFRAVSYMGSDAWYTFKYGVSGAPKALSSGMRHIWNEGPQNFEKLRTSVSNAFNHRVIGDKVSPQIRLYQNLQEAVQGKYDFFDLPPEWRERALRVAERNLADGVLGIQPGLAEVIKRSGIYHEHIDAMRRAARDSNSIVMVRPVNPAATGRIAEDWATKVMNIKSKSASHGPIAGALPVDPELNKIGSALERLLKEEPGNLGAIAKKRGELADAALVAKKCVADPVDCAKAVIYKTKEGQDLMHARVDGERIFAVKDEAGRLINYETKRPINAASDAFKPVEVFADPKTGLPLTADYDVLAFGEPGRMGSMPQWTDDRGFISKAQEKLVSIINKYIDHPGGNLVHHGAESNFFKSPGVDYPITIFEPSGRVLHIPQCDAKCMIDWCKRNAKICPDPSKIALDPDRILKDYFFSARSKGFNVNANPRWQWGPFSPLSGWATRLGGTIGGSVGNRLRSLGAQ